MVEWLGLKGVDLEGVDYQDTEALLELWHANYDSSFKPKGMTSAAQKKYKRLDAALQILKALEDNDIVGSAASVDVSRIDDIILWYGTRYQVNLGDNTRLEHKIACMNAVIAQMSEYQSGVLDCSFTIWPNQVGYTPFS